MNQSKCCLSKCFKCYFSLCFTKYLESQTLMGPPNTTLTLPSHASVQMVSSLPCVSPVGISATSLPCVCAARLKPKLFSCPSCTTMSHHHNSHILQKSTIVNFLKKKKIHTYQTHNLFPIPKYTFETHYQTHFSHYEYYKYIFFTTLFKHTIHIILNNVTQTLLPIRPLFFPVHLFVFIL